MLKERIEQEEQHFHQNSATPTNVGVTREQLEIFNLLVHPIWVFDIETTCMAWANEAALVLWDADTLNSLLQRDYASDMSESTHLRLKEYQVQFAKGEKIKDQWTYYPKGQAKTVAATCSGIRLSPGWLGHDKLSMLVEAIPLAKGNVEQQESLRGVEMLRHLPMAVCQFDMKGNVIFQNPEAQKMFGLGSHQEECNIDDNSKMHQINATNQTDEERTRNAENNPISIDDGRRTTRKRVLNKHRNEVLATGCSTNNRLENECHFLARFADKQQGQSVMKQVQDGKDCSVEAFQITQKGPIWSAIEVRRATDPVTSRPVILYSALDITDTLLAKKETEENIKRSEFFAVMAHEIRTPLHQVTGFIDLLHLTELTSEQRSFVRLLKTSASSLLVVINDLLDYSKLEAGKMNLESIPFDPKSVLRSSLESVRPQIEGKRLTLSSELHHDGIPFNMLGDPNRLRQILLNLLQNAVKFTSQGNIHLRAEGIQDSTTKRPLLRVSVSDTGIGIAEEQMKRLFVKYQQADTSVARNYGGTGLGLSICKQLVENMGGEIGIKSKTGAGATFWFTIPIEIPKITPGSNNNCPAEEDIMVLHDAKKQKTNDCEITDDIFVSSAPVLNVLVAEDNIINQKLATSMLTRVGHKVTIADNGRMAVEAIIKHGVIYDAVLMDIQMPIMDGIEATKLLRSQGYTKLPIIALTACVLRDDFGEIGFDDWVGKPLKMNELCKKLHRIGEVKKQKDISPSLTRAIAA